LPPAATFLNARKHVRPHDLPRRLDTHTWLGERLSTTIFLVHGTLAKNAPWTQPGSALRTQLEAIDASGHISIEPSGWSGSNFHSHRIRAASELFSKLEAARISDPNRRLIVVGHSHGGTIISLMLSRYPAAASYLTGAVFLSTPFLVASRRPHTDGLIGLSEYALPLLDVIICTAIAFGFFALLTLTGEYFDWFAPVFWVYWLITLYATAGKLTNTRLPDIGLKLWFANLLGWHFGTLLVVLTSATVYNLIKHASQSPSLAFLAGAVSFVATAIATWSLMRRMNLLRPTVGDVSHITTSIARLLDDFKQSSLPPQKALVVRFTSDEASLLLSLAQATVKALDFFVKALVAFFTTFSFDFWRATRRRLGLVNRIAWLAVLAVFLILFTHTFLGFFSAFLGLLFAAIGSLLDAVINLKVPDTWNFSKSLPVVLFDWLEPYLVWSVDFASRGRYTTNPLLWAIAIIVAILTSTSLILSLPFGATSFWGSLYVNFSVESAPVGDCQVVTFAPVFERTNFWTETPLFHSLAYSDSRSITVIRDKIAAWINPRTDCIQVAEGQPLASQGAA